MELIDLENLFFISPDWERSPKYRLGDYLALSAKAKPLCVKGISWGITSKTWRYLLGEGDTRVSVSEEDLLPVQLPPLFSKVKPKYKIGEQVKIPLLYINRTLISGVNFRTEGWAYYVRYRSSWLWVPEGDLCKM